MLVASVAFAVAVAPRGSRPREPDAGHCNDGGGLPARARPTAGERGPRCGYNPRSHSKARAQIIGGPPRIAWS